MTAIALVPRDGNVTHFLDGTGVLSQPKLDALAAPTGPLSLSGQRATSLGTPTGATDAATKGYADSIATGLEIKAAVRVATTANITLSAPQTIDGVAVIAGDRVLVKNQTAGETNGIYDVAAGAWARSSDANATGEVNAGMIVFVQAGATQANESWALTTANPITLGTTALVFTQFAGVPNAVKLDDNLAPDDNTDLDASTSRHGLSPKLPGNPSLFYNGVGAFSAPPSVTSAYLPGPAAWWVNPTLSVSGAGTSPGAGFKTVAEAVAASADGEVIHLCANVTELVTLNKRVKLLGVGTYRTITAPGTATAITDVIVNVTVQDVHLENLKIRGHATWKGVGVCNNNGLGFWAKNVDINGGVGTATAYPTTPAAGTGLGGIGFLHHFAEACVYEKINVSKCSIGFATGMEGSCNKVWGTHMSGNVQDLVMGLMTSTTTTYPASIPMRTGPFPYGGGNGGGWEFNFFKSVAGTVIAGANAVDLIGDGTVNYSGANNGQNTFINFSPAESAGSPYVRIGSRNNVFIDMVSSPQATTLVEGPYNRFYNTRVLGWYGLTISGNFTMFDGLWCDGVINGSGYGTYIRNGIFTSHSGGFTMNMTAALNQYENCLFNKGSGSAVAITIDQLGLGARIVPAGGTRVLTYGATIATDVMQANRFTVPIANNNAFAMSNPICNYSSPNTNIFCTEPVTWIFENGAGVPHGDINAPSSGSLFDLAGGGTQIWPGGTIAPGKSRQLTAYYNPATGRWRELSRSTADIG